MNPTAQNGRRGRNKKLRNALRWQLEQKGTDDFLADIIEEEADAAFLADDLGPPEEAQVEPWANMYFSAFNALRDDRQYSDSGGCARISYLAIDRWAARHQIQDDEFGIFHALIRAMDDEYVAWFDEEAAKAAEKARNKET